MLVEMTGLDYLTFVVLIVLVGAGLVGAGLLGSLPGKIAAARAHPQADAIRVTGWLGLLTMGLLFPIALVWAYTKPSASQEVAQLRQEISDLQDRVEAFESGRAPNSKNGAPTS